MSEHRAERGYVHRLVSGHRLVLGGLDVRVPVGLPPTPTSVCSGTPWSGQVQVKTRFTAGFGPEGNGLATSAPVVVLLRSGRPRSLTDQR